MPVTFTVSSAIQPSQVVSYQAPGKPETVFKRVWGSRSTENVYQEFLQSTFSFAPGQLGNLSIHPRNGFVDTLLYAYNDHHNLVISPDNVWIAILTQFNFYVNAHAEELRSQFVEHEGKKHLVIEDVGTRYTVDFGKLATRMTTAIQENVVDPELQQWILPNFSTTTSNDTVVCAVTMMATMKAYFTYEFQLRCGIPSVTLLGEKEDWERILEKIEKLKTFGAEPTLWASLLRPIITCFLDAFHGNYNIQFWSRICHIDSFGSGPSYLSGWINAFCVWNSDGKWIGPVAAPGSASCPIPGIGAPLANSAYHRLDMSKIPAAICEVDVLLDDNGERFDCVMVAGHVGSITSGAARDTVQPFPAWFLAIKNNAA
ncbi:hypothetical protein CVT24_002943 [Panaeolus cyanescens]|uniref:Uncharacterized protein n=1 Tax=Panaeolus cyanescens TaxID=181874 RepID=A0A409VPD2_9AGAR|nr:hypothetical protein CVT24_002943 [Panaeolus cyanescens]